MTIVAVSRATDADRLLSAIAAAGGRLPRSRRGFLRAYYANTDIADITSRDPRELAVMALSHLKFARRRHRAALVRVFNPTMREHGYLSPHTVVEMVNDDMPFLVDSIGLAVTQRGLALHFLAHPVMRVAREADGTLRAVVGRDAADERAALGPSLGRLESLQHVEVDRIVEPDELRALQTQIESSLRDVRRACADWTAMRDAAGRVADELESRGSRFDPRDVSETRALLEWMQSHHFMFLGYREYRLRGSAGHETLEPAAAGGLGILRRTKRPVAGTGRILASDIRRQSRARTLALVTKANVRSTVHRQGYLDYVGVKHLDSNGRLLGEHRFLGLWTSAAYSTNPREIPLVRHKVALVMEHFAFAPDSHDGKALQHILETFPRDELFQAAVPELVAAVTGILGLQERPRVRLLWRRDPFRRFYSCLVFVPRDRYTTLVRERIEGIIAAAFDAVAMESQVQIAESNLARIHIVARTLPTDAERPDSTYLEQRIAAAVTSWADSLRSALLASVDEASALKLYGRYRDAFPAAYTEDFGGQAAALDVSFLEALEKAPTQLHLAIYRLEPKRKDTLFLKIFRAADAIALSDLLPMLENMGLKVIAERPYRLEFAGGRRAWIQDLEMQLSPPPGMTTDALDFEMKETFAAVWNGRTDSDGFNQLLAAAIPWRLVTVLRAYCRFLIQAGLPFSSGYFAHVLIDNARSARALCDLFEARFDPSLSPLQRRRTQARVEHRLRELLEKVSGSDEDRILRALWDTVAATVRTNAYQSTPTGEPKSYLSFKMESQRLRELPRPVPLFEVYVFSTRMEGVHLRMGHVARGGIRASDRREDFRTEILGLMKAQQVKNTVIVPVGAKGGFIVRRLPTDEEANQAEIVACYRTLIRGMLDITDNIVEDRIVGPPSVVRHDGDDAYLVVAADKGTARFSDIANELSAEYGFWLGDAFASGGSAGYDHKKMAITARGAWTCVDRHFRELGIDVQRHDVSVVGIGDMAGDVFGNGMLRSRHIRLLAAFNHQHIFIDPQPDAARSFKERARLYRLPRSSWSDYSPAAFSKGGAVFLRSSKSLSLSAEVQALLELPPHATPNETIKAILKSHVDLLWNGGIGTYVKAGRESHGDVGDRTNDAVRIDAADLHCKVVGEGGNLGLSQLGRIEFARRGGRLNTDFLDNSAGVNCSDVEVNLKILLDGAMRAREITRGARDRLLKRMTDEVAALVLRNNYLQSQAISTAEFRGKERLAESAYVIRALERSGDLDRALEFLPSDEELGDRRKAGEGLTRPELAVTLSYGKIWLYKALIRSDVPEDPYLSGELARYFPVPVQQRFTARLKHHRLRREIIATAITNSLINRMGPVFPIRAQEDSGADPAAIARAYSIAREVFATRDLWTQIEALDTVIPAAVQYTAMFQTTRLLHHATYWLLDNRRGDLGIERTVRRYVGPVAQLARGLGAVVSATDQVRLRGLRSRLIAQHVPEALATQISWLDLLHSALDLVETAIAARVDIIFAAAAYFDIGERLGLAWIREQIEALPAEGHWQAVARATLSDNLYKLHREITAAAVACKGRTAADRNEQWLLRHAPPVESLKRVVVDLRTGAAPDFATLSVALQAVRRLVQDGAHARH